MKKTLSILFTLLPSILSAQPLEFELQPEAFPVELNGWEMFSPWAGGMDATTPELCDIDADGDLDLFLGMECSFISYFQNDGSANQSNFTYVTYCYDSMSSFVGGWTRSEIELADLGGDGDVYLFVGDTYGGIRFFRNMEFNLVNGEPGKQPYTFTLNQNYPNPFNASTAISCKLQVK